MAAPSVSTKQHSDGEGLLDACSKHISSNPSLDDLEVGSHSPWQHHDVRSTYHIYHQHESHVCISPAIDPSKERFWGPTAKEQKEKRRKKKLEAARKKDGLAPVDSQSEADDGAFFLHTPYLALHDPPQVLYMGSTKKAVPVALIYNSFLWRTWKLQLGSTISKPGVLDPRGVVCWRHNGGDNKALEADDRLLKGYRVRNWRLWGENGKEYVHDVKRRRETGTGPDPDVIKADEPIDCDDSEKELSIPAPEGQNSPTRAEEVVYLKWTSPFSKDTRRYHFQFGGIDFFWKGTGTVKESRPCGFFLHFNHLKLVAQLPASEEEGPDLKAVKPEVCLGKYTCSIAAEKNGRLELYDGAIWRLLSRYMLSYMPQEQPEERPASEAQGGDTAAKMAMMKKTLLYQAIIATAMCMILGEKQKRETVMSILAAAAGEGAGGAG